MKDSIVQEPTTPIKRVYNQTVALAHQHAGANGGALPRILDFHKIRSVAVSHESFAVSTDSKKY